MSPCTKTQPRIRKSEPERARMHLVKRSTWITVVPNKAISYIYQRDPTEKTYLPGPLPPARVENNDIKIAAAGRSR